MDSTEITTKIAYDLTEIIPNPTPNGEHYRIVRGSMGSFLSPPGHPNHHYEVRGARNPRKLGSDPDYMGAVDSAVDEEYLPTSIRDQARRLIAEAPMVYSPLWESYLYSYFKNSYSPDGQDRNVSNSVRTGPPEHHLAYLLVKEHFPEAEPRPDLIEAKPDTYGNRPCVKCGTRLQYEAKVDAFAEAITAKLTCPKGMDHSIASKEQEA